ncbi:MAG TPA: hypothetical protein VFW53_06775 [Gallionella sp.]|nr:hypothetical protein [Gallionella sp.]
MTIKVSVFAPLTTKPLFNCDTVISSAEAAEANNMTAEKIAPGLMLSNDMVSIFFKELLRQRQ